MGVGVAPDLSHALLATSRRGRVGVGPDQDLMPHAAWTRYHPDLADWKATISKVVKQGGRLAGLSERRDEH